MAKNRQVHFEVLSSNIIRSNIHKDTRIYKYHFIVDSSVDKGSYISLNARIYNTSIGKFCSIGPNLVCGWGIHPIDGISTSPVFYSVHQQAGFTYCKKNKAVEIKPVTIGNDVFIGANVTILDGVTIGDGAVIGAGAVVSKDIPPYAVAIGCPIKVVKFRFPKETIKKLLDLKWWNKNEKTLQKVEKHFYDVEGFLESEAYELESERK